MYSLVLLVLEFEVVSNFKTEPRVHQEVPLVFFHHLLLLFFFKGFLLVFLLHLH